MRSRRAPSASIPAVAQACSRASRESFIRARTRRCLPTCDHGNRRRNGPFHRTGPARAYAGADNPVVRLEMTMLLTSGADAARAAWVLERDHGPALRLTGGELGHTRVLEKLKRRAVGCPGLDHMVRRPAAR